MIASFRTAVAGVALGAASLFLASASPALAVAHGTLTFDAPTGPATATDSIPVYFSFTLDSDSEALQTGAGGVPTLGGPTDDELAARGFDLSQDHQVILNVSYTCSGNFNACSGTEPYDFNFNYDLPSFIGGQDLSIAPGESVNHVLFGTFVPHDGIAPAGDYTFHTASLIFAVYGEDADGGQKFDSFQIATTCVNGDDACAFSRSVTPVPEPGEWAMMAAGLAIVAGAARRRRAKQA